MIKAIVTDIEGTTSSISFVKEVLFPYAKQHMRAFITQHKNDEQVKTLLQDVNRTVGRELTTEEQIRQLIKWIDEDKKITPLKAIQGLIWESGFKKGAYKGHMYKDAVKNLQKWSRQGIHLYIFSSGSVYAQKLIFGHTSYGDLTPLFEGYFDTTIGGKKEVFAYNQIIQTLKHNPSEILFLSDIQEELDAAGKAGMHTHWIIRDGEIHSKAAHRQVKDFDHIHLG